MLHMFDTETLQDLLHRKATGLIEVCAMLERVKVPTEEVDKALKDLAEGLGLVLLGNPPRPLQTGVAQALYTACRQRGVWTEGESMNVFLMTILEVLRCRGVEVAGWDE